MSFMGWLGRQIGHVKKAIQAPVEPRTLYRQTKVEEASLPDRPGVTLRRTITDEVILKRKDQANANR